MAQIITVNLQRPIAEIQSPESVELTQAKLLIWFDSIVRQIDSSSKEAVDFQIQGAPSEGINRLIGETLAGLPALVRQNPAELSDDNDTSFAKASQLAAATRPIADQLTTIASILAFKPNNYIAPKAMFLLNDVKDLSIINKMFALHGFNEEEKIQSLFSCISANDEQLFSKAADAAIAALASPDSSVKAQLALARMDIRGIDIIVKKLIEAIPNDEACSIDTAIQKWTNISDALAIVSRLHRGDRAGIESTLEAHLLTANNQDEKITLSRALALMGTTSPELALEAITPYVDKPPHPLAQTFITDIRDRLQTRAEEIGSITATEDERLESFIQMLRTDNMREDAKTNLVNFTSIRGNMQSIIIEKLASNARVEPVESSKFLDAIAEVLTELVKSQPPEDLYMQSMDQPITPTERTKTFILSYLGSRTENKGLEYVKQRFETLLNA